MPLSLQKIPPRFSIVKQTLFNAIREFNTLEAIILILGLTTVICETIDKLPIIWYGIFTLLLLCYFIDKWSLYERIRQKPNNDTRTIERY